MQLAQDNHNKMSSAQAISHVTCKVETNLARLAPVREQWDEFVARCGGDIYFTYDWCCTWWRHYGRGRQLRVLLFYQADALVGLMPLVIDRFWLGPVPIRLAKLLGSDSTTVVLSPPVLPECAEAVYSRVLTYVLQEKRCDALWLGPLSGERPHRDYIRAACRQNHQRVCLIQDQDQTVHTVFHLPATYEGYLASLEKDHRAMVRRERRIFEKQCQPTVELLDEPEQLGPAFNGFLQLHRLQWTAQNMLGHFGDMPRSEAFNRDLIAALGSLGRVWVLRITADNQAVAYEYAFVFADGLYWRLPARQVGEAWERLSLGRVSLAYLVERAIGRRIRWIEGGAGHYPYKRRMGAVELPVGSMLLAANRRGSLLKTRLFSHASRLLHLLYYRIWFSRIAPRLPLPRRPLWSLWIRSRI